MLSAQIRKYKPKRAAMELTESVGEAAKRNADVIHKFKSLADKRRKMKDEEAAEKGRRMYTPLFQNSLLALISFSHDQPYLQAQKRKNRFQHRDRVLTTFHSLTLVRRTLKTKTFSYRVVLGILMQKGSQ